MQVSLHAVLANALNQVALHARAMADYAGGHSIGLRAMMSSIRRMALLTSAALRTA